MLRETDILLFSKRNQHPCRRALTRVNILTTFDLKSTNLSSYKLREIVILLVSK